MKFTKMTLIYLVLGFLLGQVMLQAQGSTVGCIAVWYDNPTAVDPTGFESVTENLDIIDVASPFWYSPYPDGTIQAHIGAEDEDALAALREAGVTILPAIYSVASMMIETPEIRTVHVANIVELVERMDYDGIDIDYESFLPSTRDDFSLFIEELADALHENDRLLSVTVHPKVDDESVSGGAAAQDWERLAAASDVFRIMTYDYIGRNGDPGPIGPPLWQLEVLAYAQSVTDLSKVRLGIHFYGYSWQRGTPPATTVTWESVRRYVESFDLEITRDETDMEAFLDFKVTGLARQTVYMADAVGIDYKLNLVLEHFPDLGGIAIWGLGGEDPENWDVLRAVSGGCEMVSP